VIYSKIIASGSYLPEKILTNDDLSKVVDTSDEWITTRTGIKERHIAANNECTSDLATAAGLDALKSTGISASEIDLIIVATTTPDNTFPATAAKVQANLGAINAFVFDIQAVCSGFVFALKTADAYIKSGHAKTVMVIGAETLSRIVDWTDRNTCVLFGDGAGAVILQANESSDSNAKNAIGILNVKVKSDGRYYNDLKTTSGVSSGNEKSFITMNGPEVFKMAIAKMPEISIETVKEIGLKAEDISWIVPHQANIRIIESAAKNLDVAREKIIVTIDKHANTSAASIPLAFDNSVKAGKIKRGDVVVMTSMGGGFTWGCVVVRY
jgi:3-oxoacyl-[acyl-carrier-protein] synthase-3